MRISQLRKTTLEGGRGGENFIFYLSNEKNLKTLCDIMTSKSCDLLQTIPADFTDNVRPVRHCNEYLFP